MSSSKEGFSSKVGKFLRYCRLYGPSRAMIKARQHYHLKRVFRALPRQPAAIPPHANVGLIGCGGFGYGVIAYFLTKRFGRILRGVMDTDSNRAASLCQRYGAGYYTTNAQEIISDPKIEIVFVASTHSTHCDYAIETLRARKHVHIEKPHVVSKSQLDRLIETMRESDKRVSLGFNRTVSPLAEKLFHEISKQVGGVAASWAVIGHPISDSHWYARPEEGGRVFGNLCHWTDFLYTMIPKEARYPIQVRGTRVSDSEIALTLSFSEKHIATIMFSALGDTFEGVRESLTVQRGNLIASLKDFRQLDLDVGSFHRTHKPWFQDHGHEERIARSMSMLHGDASEFSSIEYVRGTGELFLGASEALATGQAVVLEKPGQ